jgi:hypothetical protein
MRMAEPCMQVNIFQSDGEMNDGSRQVETESTPHQWTCLRDVKEGPQVEEK